MQLKIIYGIIEYLSLVLIIFSLYHFKILESNESNIIYIVVVFLIFKFTSDFIKKKIIK